MTTPEPSNPAECSGEPGPCPEHGHHTESLKRPAAPSAPAIPVRAAELLQSATVPDEPSMTGGFDDSIEIPELSSVPADRDLRDRIEVWPLARVLAEVRCGSQDWSWDEEWADLDKRHAETGYLAKLEQQISENGITMPVLIGSDGRLWDGHHRLRIAVRRGIGYVPVEIAPSRLADEVQQDGPVVTVHTAGNLSPEAAEALGALADVAKAQFGCDFTHPHPEHPCGRQADPAQQVESFGPEVVAYRNPDRPRVLLCREHGDGWAGLTPLTADDLPDGGLCTWGDPAEPGEVCGVDVLIPQPGEGR
ncbi:ParB N-terminal domain-containing protein [Streptomyces sp. NPDC046853]|uniref:ParB N-terminal domain-containing protein n=1 Tax=Streptomyces sp. NPDC046853 TaxID=3154920 RepID=UPI00340F5E61